MNLRTAVITACVVDAVIWVVVALATFMSGSDAATKGLDQGAGLIVTALFLVTGVPAVALVAVRRAPGVALALALTFPVVLAIAFVAALVAFA